MDSPVFGFRPMRAARFAKALGHSEERFVELALQSLVDEAGLKLKRRYRETHCISMFTSEYAVKGTRKFAHSLSQAHCAMKRVSVLMVDTRSRLQMLARLIRDDSINYRENIY